MGEVPWEDLETRGYVVVRGFLRREQVETLAQDFLNGSKPEDHPFGFKPIGRRAMAAVRETLEEALAEIRLRTSLLTDSINFLTLSHYVAAWLAQRPYVLHQDFDLDYRLTHDHKNYLNFWMPVIKPDPARSNVGVVPLDKLKSRSPESYSKVLGLGGCRWVPLQGKTAAYGGQGEIFDQPGEPLCWLDLDLEELLEIPIMDNGDLLLMRGDVIHRTQDLDTARVAASVRATALSKLLTRERAVFEPGDPAKPIIDLLQRCFQRKSTQQVTIGEFLEFAQGRL